MKKTKTKKVKKGIKPTTKNIEVILQNAEEMMMGTEPLSMLLKAALNGKAYYLKGGGSKPTIIAMIGRESSGRVERIEVSAIEGARYSAKEMTEVMDEIMESRQVSPQRFFDALNNLRDLVWTNVHLLDDKPAKIEKLVYKPQAYGTHVEKPKGKQVPVVLG